MSESKEVIPEAAVEAAVRCFPGYDPDWEADELDRAENAAIRSRALQILEAAAPFIATEAWHRGYVAALDGREPTK
jgi:hypothetical protein